MVFPRRQFLRLAAGAAALPALSRIARAQAYPSKLIRVVVPFTPGSPVDALARIVTQELSVRLGQSIVIDNRPGAGTSIGTKAVMTANPDGYTLLLTGPHVVYIPTLYPHLHFEATKSLAPVATLCSWSHVLVIAPSVPANTVAELVAYARANPNKLNFGFGLGTTPHLLGETLKLVTGAEINSIPYRGGAQAVTDLLGGRIDMNFGTTATLLPLIQQGKVRALAYTDVARSPDLPNVPTMSESGFPEIGYRPDSWQAVLAPPGTPAAVIHKLNTEINESLKSPTLTAALATLGFEPKITTPEEFAAFLAQEADKFPPIIKATGLKPE
jgi:tripartite-type tricarboxylate transporter receptor subunit TctC